jgi:CRISPR-associated protein Cmr6
MMKGKIRLIGGGNFIILSKEKKGPKSYQVDRAFKGVAAALADSDCQFEVSKNGFVYKIIINGKTYTKGEVGAELLEKSRKPSVPIDTKPTVADRGIFRLPLDTANLLSGKQIDNFFLKHYVATTWQGAKVDPIKLEKSASYSSALPRPDLILKRYEDSIKMLCSGGKKYRIATVKTDSRLVVGLGTSTVYETGMTLHHIYGIPYLPGTALKGICRSYVIKSFFGSKEDKALRNDAFRVIFGAPKDGKMEEISGAIRFHDALPADEPTIRVDIMNPHYGDYYNGNTPPADFIQPVPVTFLTVTDSSFQLAVSESRQSDEVLSLGDKSGKALELAWDFLNDALREQGVGAKTAIGYGRMS